MDHCSGKCSGGLKHRLWWLKVFQSWEFHNSVNEIWSFCPFSKYTQHLCVSDKIVVKPYKSHLQITAWCKWTRYLGVWVGSGIPGNGFRQWSKNNRTQTGDDMWARVEHIPAGRQCARTRPISCSTTISWFDQSCCLLSPTLNHLIKSNAVAKKLNLLPSVFSCFKHQDLFR